MGKQQILAQWEREWLAQIVDYVSMSERCREMYRDRILTGDTYAAVGARHGVSKSRIHGICSKVYCQVPYVGFRS